MKRRVLCFFAVCVVLVGLCSCTNAPSLPEPTNNQKVIVLYSTNAILGVETTAQSSGSYTGFSVSGNVETFSNCKYSITVNGVSIEITLNGTATLTTGSDTVVTMNLTSVTIPVYGTHSLYMVLSTNAGGFSEISVDGQAINPAAFN